jgi:hypothetical protein
MADEQTAITPSYAEGETDSTIHGRPYRRFVRACPRGWLVSAVAVSCVDCPRVQHFYGEPDIARGQMLPQVKAEGWTYTQVPKVDQDGTSLLFHCPVCSMKRPRIGKRRRDWFENETV